MKFHGISHVLIALNAENILGRGGGGAGDGANKEYYCYTEIYLIIGYLLQSSRAQDTNWHMQWVAMMPMISRPTDPTCKEGKWNLFHQNNK